MGISLTDISKEARANSERWFTLVHNQTEALIPLRIHYYLGLAGEVGEVGNLLKKWLRNPSIPLPRFSIESELADVFTYLILLAGELEIDLIRAYEMKREINQERWGRETS